MGVTSEARPARRGLCTCCARFRRGCRRRTGERANATRSARGALSRWRAKAGTRAARALRRRWLWPSAPKSPRMWRGAAPGEHSWRIRQWTWSRRCPARTPGGPRKRERSASGSHKPASKHRPCVLRIPRERTSETILKVQGAASPAVAAFPDTPPGPRSAATLRFRPHGVAEHGTAGKDAAKAAERVRGSCSQHRSHDRRSRRPPKSTGLLLGGNLSSPEPGVSVVAKPKVHFSGPALRTLRTLLLRGILRCGHTSSAPGPACGSGRAQRLPPRSLDARPCAIAGYRRRRASAGRRRPRSGRAGCTPTPFASPCGRARRCLHVPVALRRRGPGVPARHRA